MIERFNVAIAIVVFNRLDCAIKLMEVIKDIKPTKLYIISDGPRNTEEKKKVLDVRQYIENEITWDCEINRLYSETNLGCDDRSVSGYNAVFQKEEKAILIEDDAIPTKEFFGFCKKMLDVYEKDERIWMITGENTYPQHKSGERDYYFSAMPAKKAWATWARAWKHMDVNMSTFPEKSLNKLTPDYPIWARIYYWGAYLGAYNGGKAWDAKWDYVLASNGALGIIPCRNMVKEIGYNRADATHTHEDHPLAHLATEEYGREVFIRDDVSRDYDYDKRYLQARFKGSLGFLLREYTLFKLRQWNIGKPLIKKIERKHR